MCNYTWGLSNNTWHRANLGETCYLNLKSVIHVTLELWSCKSYVKEFYYNIYINLISGFHFMRINGTSSLCVYQESTWASGRKVPLIFNLAKRWGCLWLASLGETLNPPYPPQKSPRYPLNKTMNGLQNRTGRSGEEKNILPSRNRTTIPRFPAPTVVCIPIKYNIPLTNKR
jgi:hypothetical protein